MPAISSGDAALAAAEDPEEGDDSGLRWTVAGVVSCIPCFAWLAWLLPALGAADDDVNSTGTGRSAAGLVPTYGVYTALYLLAYLNHGFDPTDGATWAVTIACAVHVQLERVVFQTAGSQAAALPLERGGGDGFNLPSIGQQSSNPLAPGQGEGGADGTEKGEGTQVGGAVDANARQLGRVLGEASVSAQRALRGGLAEGALRAKLDMEAEMTDRALREEAQYTAAEMEEWDRRFQLRSMSRAQLMDIARDKGLKGYSKMRKAELVDLIEEMEEQQEEEQMEA